MTDLMTVIPATTLALLQGPLDQNAGAVYLAGLGSPGSRRTMRQSLDMVAAMVRPGTDAFSFPWHELRYQRVAALRSRLAAAYAPATASRVLCAVRGTLKECWRLGQIPEEHYRRTIDIGGVRGETLPAGRALPASEIAALLNVCADDPTPAGRRDGALLAMLYATGARRAEACGLDLSDFTLETGELKIRRGKGGKARLVYILNGANAWLRDWLELRGAAPGPLFLPVGKSGRIGTGRLSTQAVYALLAKRARQAGIEDVSPHDLRRSCVTGLLEAGVDLLTVSHLAGHSSPTTTARYDKRGEVAKRSGAGMLFVPYRGATA
jgi:integrase